jgi:acyl dehydratase
VTPDTLDAFMRVSKDYAPAHCDTAHARTLGFREPIVHGFCTSLPFSRLMGMYLPGPSTVIQSLEFRFKKEVYVGDRITYRVAVSRLSAAVGAVRLLLSVKRDDGEVVLEGTAQCVFPPKS